MRTTIPSIHIYNPQSTQGQSLHELHVASGSEDELLPGDFCLVEGAFEPQNYHHLGDEAVVMWLDAHSLTRLEEQPGGQTRDKSTMYVRGVLFVPERPARPWVEFDMKLLRQHCSLIRRAKPLWYRTDHGWRADSFMSNSLNPWQRIYCYNAQKVLVGCEPAIIEEEDLLALVPESPFEFLPRYEQKLRFRAIRFAEAYGVSAVTEEPLGGVSSFDLPASQAFSGSKGRPFGDHTSKVL